MKKALIAAAFLVLAAASFAESAPPSPPSDTPVISPLPTELSGRWFTPDKRYTQTWEMKKIKGGSATLTWWSTRSSCNLYDVPAEFTYDGKVLVVVVKDQQFPSRSCSSKFIATLIKKEGMNEFEGEVEHILSGSSYPVLHTTIR